MPDDSPRPSLQTASASNTSPSAPFVDISIDDPKWDSCGIDLESLMLRCFELTLKHVVKKQGPFELSVLLTNDIEIQKLNAEYRHKDKPTNVLSFESGLDIHHLPSLPKMDQPLVLGDLVLSFETLSHEASQQGKTLQNHLTHLTVHGILHLLGFDHGDDGEAKAMETLEITILKTYFDLDNPYEETAGAHGKHECD